MLTHTSDGQPYYYNVHTLQTRWTLPSAPPSFKDIGATDAASSTTRSTALPSASPTSRCAARYDMSPTSFRAEVRVMKRNHYVLREEMREIIDPIARQRQAREIATLEMRLAERGIYI